MKKMKLGMMFLVVSFASLTMKAQTIEDGKNFLYLEKIKSARTAFEKLVAANPNDLYAAYWL